VRDESAFLRQLTDRPDDLDTLLVYADWLDDQGDSARAEFLRLQQQLLPMRLRQKGFTALSRRLLTLGKQLKPAWLAVVSRPRLVGTCWRTEEPDGRSVFRFLPDGELNYTESDGDTYQNATWVQVGNHVAIEFNRHYADYEGFIAGDRMSGKAKNITGNSWNWRASITTDPELCDLGEPDTTVYDSHVKE
jgi:uncharacterized protein (TIGR02996 family)